MGVAELSGGVLEWSTGQRGDPQRPQKLKARQPPWVFRRMPLVQLVVCLDHLGVLQELVAEVVHDGGDGEDATEAFIERRLGHTVLLPRSLSPQRLGRDAGAGTPLG